MFRTILTAGFMCFIAAPYLLDIIKTDAKAANKASAERVAGALRHQAAVDALKAQIALATAERAVAQPFKPGRLEW